MRKWVIGVMGPGEGARPEDISNAFELGKLIGKAGWVLLSGGRDAGVMDAVNKGAKAGGALTIGVIPTADKKGISEGVDVAILTGMGSARNSINVLSSDVVIACGMARGTASETALALKAGKNVILLNTGGESEAFFRKIAPTNIYMCATPAEAIALVREILSNL